MNLQEHVGPLPAWGWLVIAVGGAGGYFLVKKLGAGSGAILPTADTSNQASAGDVSNLEQQLQALSSQFQDSQGQLTTMVGTLSDKEQSDLQALNKGNSDAL